MNSITLDISSRRKGVKMDAEEQMQAIVEAAGECWHKRVVDKVPSPVEGCFDYFPRCDKCEIGLPHHSKHPSPHDLNELVRLADKLGFDEVRIDLHGMADIIQWNLDFPDLRYEGRGETPVDALRNALYQSVTGGR